MKTRNMLSRWNALWANAFTSLPATLSIGYRAALRVIDTVGGLESTGMIDHTLLLEYRLGYIGSYEQVEREQERKKKTA